MKSKELNEYIKHYLENDKTRSAVMLNAPWGTGKTHYIQKELIPYLKDNGDYTGISISLYGVNSTEDIGKRLFMDAITEKFNIKKESKLNTPTAIIGKNIINNFLSSCGLNIQFSNQEIQNLYKSLDFSKTLIIFEDVERCSLDITQLFGYINTLTEIDGIKILLVCNEKKFITYDNDATTDNKSVEDAELWWGVTRKIEYPPYSESSLKYIAAKEKTVGDTINFENEFPQVLKQIINEFNNHTLNSIATDDLLKIISGTIKGKSLRDFIFACQKTVDIFQKIHNIEDKDFLETIFIGNINFAIIFRDGQKIQWEGNKDFDASLSSSAHPLFRFCYDYITTQNLDISKISKAKEALTNYRLYDENSPFNDNDLSLIFKYHIHSEQEVNESLKNLFKKVKDENCIPFHQYGNILRYLVAINFNLEIDTSSLISLLLENLNGKGDSVDLHSLFSYIHFEEDPEFRKELENIAKKAETKLQFTQNAPFEFNYLPEQLNNFYENICRNSGSHIFNDVGSFFIHFDLDKLSNMFFECTPMQMQDYRGIFLAIYRPSNIADILYNDKKFLKEFLNKLESNSNIPNLDKVQKLHYKWLIECINSAIKKYS